MLDYTDLIGRPFAYGGRGPDTYDCYGLVRECLRRAGRPVPDLHSPSELAVIAATVAIECTGGHWVEVPRRPGAVVLLRIMGLPAHVGYLLPENRMLHTWEATHGVVVENMSAWDRRVVGCYDFAG